MIFNTETNEKSVTFSNPDLSIPEDIQIIETDGLNFKPENIYYAFYDTNNHNRIVGVIGMPVEIEQFNNLYEHILPINLGYIDEQSYNILKMSKENNELMAFYDVESGLLFYRRIFLELTGDTFFNHENSAICSPSNKPSFKVFCLDTNENPADDVKIISIKSMRNSGELNSIQLNGNDVDTRKIDIENCSEVSINLIGEGRHILRLKAEIPNVNGIWLTTYPEFVKL